MSIICMLRGLEVKRMAKDNFTIEEIREDFYHRYREVWSINQLNYLLTN